MKILFATTNKAKIKSYIKRLECIGIDVVTLDDLSISIDVEEDGLDPVSNAIIKASAYAKMSGLPTISLDDALFLNNVPDEIQPGTNVRRVNNKRLNDEEMIEYYINLVNEYGENGKLDGYFLKGIAMVSENQVFSFQKKNFRCFTNKKSTIINEGYPLASIQFISKFNKFKTELNKEEDEIITGFEIKDMLKFILNTVEILE